jgi:hypothetical protein
VDQSLLYISALGWRDRMSGVLSIRIVIEVVCTDTMIHLAVAIVIQDGTDGTVDRELK